jgi:Protein of unknown function (DUF973)/zinc-ribbon domain
LPYCPKCGASVVAGTQFCPSCGANLLAAPAAAPPPGSIPPPPPSWTPAGAPVTYSNIDRVALQKLRTFALIGIIGIVLAVASLFTSNITGLAMVSTVSGAISGAVTRAVIGVIVGIIGFALGIYALLKARSAFKDLMTVDREFRTPAQLVLAFFIGMVLFILALIAALGVAFAAAANYAAGSSIVSGAVVGAALILLAFLVIGGICFLLGAIGIILGLWRVGNRYGNDLIKIGGILYIIPVVDIVAPILVYIGIGEAEKKLPPATM